MLQLIQYGDYAIVAGNEILFEKLMEESISARELCIAIAATVLNSLQGCSYTHQPVSIEAVSEVGGTGDIEFTHEQLGANKHLVTVTAAPGFFETEGSIAQRIHIFANRFASKTCSGSFEFIHDPNFDQTIAGGFMKRTKTYVFICKE